MKYEAHGSRSAVAFGMRFLGCSLLLLLLFEGPLASVVQPVLCRTVARSAGTLLSLLGETIEYRDTTVFAPRRPSSFEVIYGCTALPATLLFVSAVLAWPVSVRRRMVGVVIGTAALFAVNVMRLAVLFYCSIYRPQWYERLHLTVWQSLLVVIATFFFFGFATLASPAGPARDAGAQSRVRG